MTGSVSSETHSAQSPSDKAKSTGKPDAESEQTVNAKEAQQEQNDSPSDTSKDIDKASKHSLPPLTTLTTESQPTPSTSQATAASPKASRKLPTFTSSPVKIMDEGTNTLNRHGRAQSFLTLCSMDEDERNLVDSGSMSELGGPVSARRKRSDPRGYGTLERATSYSSLTMRPLFRSANSVPLRPAPPCTTTHLDYYRHPANPANSRLIRRGTPRANNPHPVGLYFQSPYNRDGKTFEVWNPGPQMSKYTEDTDSSSGKMKARTMERSGPPKIHYSTGSVYRSSYRPPQGTLDFDRSLPTTRCGSTHNRLPAIGVVPNVMSHHRERRIKLHVPRGQKLESLV